MLSPVQISIAKSDFSLRTALVVPPIIFQVIWLEIWADLMQAMHILTYVRIPWVIPQLISRKASIWDMQ